MRRSPVIWFALLTAQAAPPADWDRFRGPNGSGVSGSDRAPVQFGPGKNVVWKTPLPPGHSSPVFAGSRIFATGLDDGRLTTLALDRATGGILWRRAVERPRQESLHKLNHPASASPVSDGRDVWVFFPDVGLLGYSGAGEERWRVPLGPFSNVYGMGASPVLANGNVILACDQSRGSFIAAWNKATGALQWKAARPEAVSGHSTPVVHRDWVIAPGSFRMDAYDASTGRLAWTAPGLPGEMKSVPVIDGNTIYIHGFNTPENDPDRLLQIPEFAEVARKHDADKDGRIGKEETPTPHSKRYFVFFDLDENGKLDQAEWNQYARTMRSENALLAFEIGGGLKWKFQRSIPQLPSPLVYRGVIYMINEGGVLTTLDAGTGKLHRQARLRGEADQYYSSPIAAAGKIYIASYTGTVSVLKAGPEQELLAANRFDEEIMATPAVVDGRLYVRTRSALYCLAE